MENLKHEAANRIISQTLMNAGELKKISKDNLKSIAQDNKVEKDKNDLIDYECCLREINSAAFYGQSKATCNPLAEKYQNLLRGNGYGLSKGKIYLGRWYITEHDVLNVSW